VAREDGSSPGTLQQVCSLTVPGPNPPASTFECVGSFTLPGGTLTVALERAPACNARAPRSTDGP